MLKIPRSRIILDLNKRNVPEVLDGAKNICARMSEYASIFVSPVPDMGTLGQQVADLDAAQLLVTGTRAKGAAAVRDAKLEVLWSSLDSERAYVQLLCDGSPENAFVWAEMAGMSVALSTAHTVPLLKVVLLTPPGNVRLEASAKRLTAPGGRVRRRVYLWRYTLDGGHTFTMADPTPVAHTIVTGLPVNGTVGFQVAAKDSVGVGEWSQIVSAFIL
jgi:hypothetical protein